MKARSEGSLFSEKACLKISSIGCPFIVEIQLQRGFDVQASYTEEQKKITCETSSFSTLHASQVASGLILLLHKLAFVGRASLHALQTKFFTLLGTSNLHTPLQNPTFVTGTYYRESWSCKKRYPNLTEYWPVAVKGQMSVSLCGDVLSGMLWIAATSTSSNTCFITSVLQLRVV